MKKASSSDIFKNGFWALGILATVGLLGYGLTYIIVMPKVSPDGFVPKMISSSSSPISSFSATLAAFVLLYAFAFLPVTVIFTVKKYNTNPFALVLAGCLIGISLVIEIINNLPIIAAWVYPGSFVSIPSDTLLYLRQVETVKFLAYDVAGFTLAYMAFFCYAIVYFRTYRLLSYTIIGSIVAFIANIPFLWLAPNMAIILMALSIFAFASVPIFLVRISVE